MFACPRIHCLRHSAGRSRRLETFVSQRDRIPATLGALALVAGALGCATTGSPEPTTRAIATDGWTPLACPSCDREILHVELQRSARADARPGRYLSARVTNRAAHTRIFTLQFTSDILADGDGAAPEELRTLSLPPAGERRATEVILLQRDGWNRVVIVAAERFHRPD